MGVGLVLIGPPGLQADLEKALKPFPAFRVWELGRVEAKATDATGGSGVRFEFGKAD